jgi:3-hydroxybutyryl-CoA dehydratase
MAEVKIYTYDELTVGQKAEFDAVITEEMLESFRKISGDINPLHCDETYARSQGHPGRVAYGMLTASLYSTLAGVYLPGKYCLLHEVDSSFNHPVYIGDTLHVTGTIKEKNDTFRFVVIKAVITNQNGEKVSKASIRAGLTDPV